MDFAEKQLAKYGWVKGDGLGRSVKGAAEPIKVRLKRDSSGVGSSPGAEFTSNWWSKVFNQAAKGISICEDVEGGKVAVETASETSLERTRKHYGNHRKELYYGGFLSSRAQLTGCITAHGSYEEVKSEDKDNSSDSDKKEELVCDMGVEEKLFEACGGRTAHKAARHGCKLNGKLQRLEDQEKALEEERTLVDQVGPGKRRKKEGAEELSKGSRVEKKKLQKRKKSKHKHKHD